MFQSLQAGLAGVFKLLPGALALLVCVWPAHGASFSDGFEGYAQDFLDKNYAGGANAAPNGSGNPWWGANPANFAVVGAENGVTPHSGAQMVRNEAGSLFQVPFFDSDSEYCNLAFRLNAGNLYYGNVVLDWWFYDPCGAGTTDPLNQTNYGDFAGLCNYATGIPGNADYNADSGGSADAPSNPVQCLMLGAAYVWGAADTTKYQAQVLGATDGLNSAVSRLTSIPPLRARQAGTTPASSSALPPPPRRRSFISILMTWSIPL